jgi:hypothetical protein
MRDEIQCQTVMRDVVRIISDTPIPCRITKQVDFDRYLSIVGGPIYCEYRVAFGINVTLQVHFRMDFNNRKIDPEVIISGPGMNRDISAAVAFCELLSQVTKLGILLNTYLLDLKIVYPYTEDGKLKDAQA